MYLNAEFLSQQLCKRKKIEMKGKKRVCSKSRKVRKSMKLNKKRQRWAHIESVGVKALQMIKDGKNMKWSKVWKQKQHTETHTKKKS